MIEIYWGFIGARKQTCKMPPEKRQSWLSVWRRFSISSPSHLVRLFSFHHLTPLFSDSSPPPPYLLLLVAFTFKAPLKTVQEHPQFQRPGRTNALKKR